MDTILGISIPLLIGILLFVKAEIIGNGFCKLGKTIWKVGTFGMTDMKTFYQEAHAKIVFEIFGILFVTGSVLFACFSVYSTLTK
jgi:multisubunit Na+/H+ antiporter MnhG subunit